MQIRPISFTADPQGLPANGFAYHIGLPNENPVTTANKIKVYDGNGGAETSNPFYVDRNGHFINLNGDVIISPWVDAESYSITVIAPSGAPFFSLPEYTSDNIAPSDIEGTIVDAVLNSLNDATTGAKVLDLSAYEYIYIQSIDSGWEDTVDGPIGGFYAHRDGTSGAAGTGDQDQFYDATGTGFTRDLEQKVKPDDTTLQVDTATNEISVIANATTYDGYIYGIDTSSSNGDDAVITSGRCADSTGAVIITAPAETIDLKARIDAGGNRINQALAADTTYYIFIVSEADGSNPRYAFDTSITATNALADWSAEESETYTLYRLVGFANTDSTPDIIAFTHTDNDWYLADIFQDQAITNPASTSGILLTLAVPLGVRVHPYSVFYAETNSNGTNTHVVLTNTDQTDVAASSTDFTIILPKDSIASSALNLDMFLTDTNGQIRYRFQSTTGRQLAASTNGWRFKR